jgi:hypothetical protein
MVKIEVNGLTLLHVGSANLVEDALAGQSCDVLFVCVPGWRNVPGFVPRLVSAVRPKTIVPFHFDDFSTALRRDRTARKIPFLSEREFRAALAESARGTETIWPTLFQPLTFGVGGARHAGR